MCFLEFSGKSKVLFYASLIVTIIILGCGAVALRGKSPTKTYSKVGSIADITSVCAYKNSTEGLLRCALKLESNLTTEILLLQIESPLEAYIINLYVNQSVLRRYPNILALKISANGFQDFAYTLRMWKLNLSKATLDSTKPDFHRKNFTYYVKHLADHYYCTGKGTLSSDRLINLANLQIYHWFNQSGLSGQNGTISSGSNKMFGDLMELRVTDDLGGDVLGDNKKVNRIESVEIVDLAFIKEKEGRVPPQPITPMFVSLTAYFLTILFVIPLFTLKKMGKSKLQVILIAGFLLRIAIAPFTSHTFDMLGCKRAVRTYYEEGELTLFSTWTSPPTWFSILIGFHAPYVLLRVLGLPDFRICYQSVLAVEVSFIKLPLILSDVLSTYLIYKICKKWNLDEGASRLAAAAYMFNPFSIFISSIWGMFDSLAVLFMLVGFYLVLDNRFFASSVMWGFGVKWYTLGLIPLLSIVSFYRDKKKRAVKKLVTSILIVVIGFGFFASTLFVPHAINGDLSYINQVLDFRLKVGGGGEDRTSVFTFFGPVLWRVFEGALSLRPFPNFFLYVFGSLYVVLLVTLIFYLRKSDCERKDRFLIFNNIVIATLLLFYLTYPQITPQCVLWILPLLILGYFLFHQINIVPLVIASSFVLPYLDTTYYIMGFPAPSDISLQAISGPLECVFGALLFSVSVSFLLKVLSSKLYVKVRKFGEHLLSDLCRGKLVLLYLGITVLLVIQIGAIFYDFANFIKGVLAISVTFTVIVQTLILITVDKSWLGDSEG